jgi:hypothetical protein
MFHSSGPTGPKKQLWLMMSDRSSLIYPTTLARLIQAVAIAKPKPPSLNSLDFQFGPNIIIIGSKKSKRKNRIRHLI